MIYSDKQYKKLKNMARHKRAHLVKRRQELEAMHLTPKQVERGIKNTLLCYQALDEDFATYERAKKGDIPSFDFGDLRKMLVPIRIAKGLSQEQLAKKLNVPVSKVFDDEQNDYPGLTLGRAGEIVRAMEARITFRLRNRRLQAA
jgi:ribosome-binding protein aMBF1 (putative translation factor)